MPVSGSVLKPHSERFIPQNCSLGNKPSLVSHSFDTTTNSLAPLHHQWLGIASAHHSLLNFQARLSQATKTLQDLPDSICLSGWPFAYCLWPYHQTPSLQVPWCWCLPCCSLFFKSPWPGLPQPSLDFDTLPRAAVALQLCFMVALECFHLPPSAQRPLEC